VKEKASLAIATINDIKEQSCISLETSMKLFKWKITPAVLCGLESIWHHLAGKNMETFEKLKATSLKHVEVERERVALAQRTDFGHLRWTRPKHALEGCLL
jgi:hypothetical protein